MFRSWDLRNLKRPTGAVGAPLICSLVRATRVISIDIFQAIHIPHICVCWDCHVWLSKYGSILLSSNAQMQIALGGGVWRIRLHPTKHNRFVAACMHSGCAIVTTHVLDGSAACQMQIGQEYKSHESIVYDVDWVHLGKGEFVTVSCSFYDNRLHFWTVEQSSVHSEEL